MSVAHPVVSCFVLFSCWLCGVVTDFVLELSFIGWYLLGMLVCCIGGIFVNPYYEMTFVELYWVLRDQVMGPQPSEPTDQNVYVDAYYREI